MNRAILDIHVLQNVPPSNINRDDTGTPKTATYGGVRRARVSSQAWKRATRKAFEELLPTSELGQRTKKIVDAVADHIVELDSSVSPEAAVELAAEVIKTAGIKVEVPGRKKKKDEEAKQESPESGYLMFLGRRQVDALAAIALQGGKGGDVEALKTHLKDKAHKAAAQRAVNSRHSVDIALFGRMVADSADLNVDAATQVAHAIATHATEIESDYYTAVDDRNREDESGAGMIGTIDFNSATLYRYAAVNVGELHRTLGAGVDLGETPSTPAQRAVRVFLDAFVNSIPSGKSNTFANLTRPTAVVVKLRDSRPVNFVTAFEEPVTLNEDGTGGYLRRSCEKLAEHIHEVEAAYGVSDTDRTWVFCVGESARSLQDLGESVNLAELLDQVEAAVAARLAPGA